jgi:uncharacterized membrane protein
MSGTLQRLVTCTTICQPNATVSGSCRAAALSVNVHRSAMNEREGAVPSPSPRRLIVAATVLGVGLGGFFDGIVLHQILQWHHMVSTPVPPSTVDALEVNTLGDGLFHGATWIVTVAGVFLLASADGQRREPHGRRILVGGLLLGWGLFNVVEGLMDHVVLGLHHVRPGPDEVAWDLAFLVWGALMILAGRALIRLALRRERSGPAEAATALQR